MLKEFNIENNINENNPNSNISSNQEDQKKDTLKIANIELSSRLIIGTGKYKSYAETRDALIASGADMITVAIKRVNVLEKNSERLQDYIDPKQYIFLPNTAGCYTAEDAIRTLRLAREMGGWNLVKLEVIGDEKTLYPNVIETIRAAKTLIADGFEVMAYTSDDLLIAKELEDIGCCAIMPLAAPIGSGLGIQNFLNVKFIVENINVPVIIDAGVGTASDAAIAMEMGCDGVLMNSAIAGADNPRLMAEAMNLAVQSGRKAFLAGRMPKKLYASASSPLSGLTNQAITK